MSVSPEVSYLPIVQRKLVVVGSSAQEGVHTLEKTCARQAQGAKSERATKTSYFA